MNLEFKHLIPAEFSPASKVWIYQSNRIFGIGEALQLEELLKDFVNNWKSHGDPVEGYANLLFGQFIVLIADETVTRVGGCSTDDSIRFIKQIEKTFSVNLFDRQSLAFLVKDKVQVLPLSQFNYAFENGFIDSETPYFNNTVVTKEQLLSNWIIPVKNSWLNRKIPVKG